MVSHLFNFRAVHHPDPGPMPEHRPPLDPSLVTPLDLGMPTVKEDRFMPAASYAALPASKRRAHTHLTLDPDSPSMQLDELPAQCRP